MSGDVWADGGDPAERLAAAREELQAAEESLEATGEERVADAADAYRTATDLLDRYVDTATGTGDFAAYVEFQDRFLGLVDDLDDDVPAADAFEEAAELLDKRRLSEDDFERARELLEPAREMLAKLERRDAAEESLRAAESDARRRLKSVEERIEELERLRAFGKADLDAPTERLREPIEAYDEGIKEDFGTYRSSASAREVLSFVARTTSYPLVEFRQPPAELREYVETTDAGEEPITKLLEYADYSSSKLDHYVDDPGLLRTRVAVHRTYLERLDADPLVVGWPPPSADRLRHRASELVSVVGRFADEGTVAALRRVRDLPRTTDYERLRTAATARTELSDDARERLQSGAVESELAERRAERERLREALD
jgi:hypothetical protein